MAMFTSIFFTEGVLPFLLVFVLVFAVLQKTKVLGDGNSKVDSLIALVIGLILIGAPQPRQYIVGIIPWLAVALVVLLILFLIYGFGASDAKTGLVLPDWFKKNSLWAAIVFVVIVVISVIIGWNSIGGWFDSEWMGNVLVLLVIGVALWVAVGKRD